MNLKHVLFIVLALITTGSKTTTAATYYSRTSGNFNQTTTWSTVSCGGAAAASVPGAADIVYICNTHTVNVTANATINSITVQSGGTLQTGTTGAGANRTLTVNGNFVLLNGSTYIHNNNQVASTTIFKGTENIEASSTFRVNNWSGTGTSLITGCNSNFGNVYLNWNPGLFYWNNNGLGYTRTIQGKLTVNNACATYLDNTAGDKTFTIGSLDILNGFLRIKQSGTGNITVNIAGMVLINGASSYLYGIYATNSDLIFNAASIMQNTGNFYGIYNGDGDVDFNITGTWMQYNGDFRGIYNTATYTAGIPNVTVGALWFAGGIHIVNYSCNTVPQTLYYTCNGAMNIMFSVNNSLFAFSRLATLGTTSPASSLDLNVAGNFTIGGTSTGEFNSNNGSGDEIINVNGTVAISNGSNYFNVIPDNMTNGHALTLKVDGAVSVTGGTTVLSSEAGQLNVQFNSTYTQSNGVLSLKAGTGNAIATISGDVNISGGVFNFNQSTTVASTGNIDVVSLGDFSQSGGTISFGSNPVSTGLSRWLVQGANYSLSGNGIITRAGAGTNTNFGRLLFSRTGSINATRSGTHLIEQVKQEVVSGCTFNMISGTLQLAAHNTAMQDMLTVRGNGILNMGPNSIASSAQYTYSGMTLEANARYRLSHPSGFYNGTSTASLGSTGNMDFTLDSLSVVEYYGVNNMVLTGINTGVAAQQRHKYGILEINHTGGGLGNFVYPTNQPASTNCVYIRHQLVLTAGKLNLGGSAVPLASGGRTLHIERANPAAVVSGAGALVSEAQDHSGILKWNISDVAGTYLLPFQTHTSSSLLISYTLISGDAGEVSFSTYPADVNVQPWPPAVNNLSSLIGLSPDNRDATVKRFWKIAPSSVSVADIQIRYTSSELPLAPYNSFSQMRAQHYDFSTNRWQPALPSQTAFAYGVTIPGVTTQTDWAIANLASPLPVSWLHVAATDETEKVRIDWVTAYEKNNDYFVVERSTDRVQTVEIGRVNGAGTTQVPQHYLLYDRQSLSGVMYYRIRQVDLNGEYSYSEWVAVNRQSAEKNVVGIWPNPADHFVTLNGVNSGDQLELIDAAGRVVLTEMISSPSALLSLQQLSKGIYTLRVIDTAKNVQTVKLIRK